MSGRHRKRSRRARKFTAIGAATATATVLTVGAAPLPDKNEAGQKIVDANVDLTAAINPWPGPDQFPDLTGGLGSAGYDLGQAAADALLRLLVENLNIAALADAAGLSADDLLDNLLGGLLGDIPATLLDDVVGSIPLDLSGLTTALAAPVTDALVAVLEAAGVSVSDAAAAELAGALGDILGLQLQAVDGDTIGGLLGLVGLDLSDLLNLSDLAGPANIITAGPVFTLLKLLGTDLGWVPGLPNSVADEIINTDYLDPADLNVNLSDLLDGIGALGPISDLLGNLGELPILGDILGNLIPDIELPELDLDIIEVRVPVVVGFGLGAFSAGAAYQQVVDNLVYQPGGPQSDEHPLLGSLTIMPMILLRNPGRANGGPLARLYPLFRLLGIDTVTPETNVESRGGIPILNTGLSLGGANLIPVKVDGTIMFDPMSDFAAWPNPVSLVNNLMAGILPTYILRGLSTETVGEQLAAQIPAIVDGVTEGPIAINLYLTIPSATLPFFEPLYLASDVLNLATFNAFPLNPFNMVANALAPAFLSMANLGYTDVYYDEETQSYKRTLTEAGVPTPFFSFPDVNWGQVPGVVINQLFQGIEKEFFSGNPTPGTPNALKTLLDTLGSALNLEDVLGGLGLEDLVGGILDNLDLSSLTQQQSAFSAAGAGLNDENARTFTVTTDTEEQTEELNSGTEESGETGTEIDEGAAGEDVAEEDVAEEDVAEEDVVDDGAAEEEQPIEVELPAEHTTPKPKKKNPVGSIIRDVTNAFFPKKTKKADESSTSTDGTATDTGTPAGGDDGDGDSGESDAAA